MCENEHKCTEVSVSTNMWVGVNLSVHQCRSRSEWECMVMGVHMGVEVMARADMIISVIVCKSECEHECAYVQE